MHKDNLKHLLKSLEQNLKLNTSYIYYDHDLGLWSRKLAKKSVTLRAPETNLRDEIRAKLEVAKFDAGFLNGKEDTFCIFAYREIIDQKTDNFGHFALIHCEVVTEYGPHDMRTELARVFDQNLEILQKTISDCIQRTLTKTHGIWSAYSMQGLLDTDGISVTIGRKAHIQSYIDPDVYADKILIESAIMEVLR
jgi:hypothetical protein